jgi:hypothetical protein
MANRKTRRALQSRAGKAGDRQPFVTRAAVDHSTADGEGRKIFNSSIDNLATVGGLSIHVSSVCKGMPTTRGGSMASMVHGKMIAHARSIGAIARSSMFDHSGILDLARMIMEGMTAFFYLREPVHDDEWKLRELILRLHATTVQIRSFRGRVALDREVQAAGYRAGQESLREQIRSNPHFAKLVPEAQEKLLNGNDIFVGGMRRAAEKTGAYATGQFDALYSYLSQHSHSAPLSFFSYERVGVDFMNPADYQFGLAGMGIELAAMCLRRTSLRHLDDSLQFNPKLASEFHAGMLNKQRELDNNYGVLFN